MFLRLYFFPKTISGAKYNGVPEKSAINFELLIFTENPKSISCISLLLLIMIFLVFKSRCAIDCKWQLFTDCKICLKIKRHLGLDRVFHFMKLCRSAMPRSSKKRIIWLLKKNTNSRREINRLPFISSRLKISFFYQFWLGLLKRIRDLYMLLLCRKGDFGMNEILTDF